MTDRITIHDFDVANLSSSVPVKVASAGASLTLTPLLTGNIVILNSTSGSTVTLPAPAAGLVFKCIVGATGGHTISAPSACIQGSISVALYSTSGSLSTSTPKTTITTGTTNGSKVGDIVNLVSDGTFYYMSGTVSTFSGFQLA
jgi:hypothetical protein